MKEGFVLRKRKVYLLSREEREEVYEFIKEQLRKEYIRLLELSQMAPVFFVGKKDGKKHIVQNFWYLKNNHPLPLILDIVESMDTKKVFTKLDLWWGYNDVWIKEGDEWKVVFKTLEELFEPNMMFFGLINFPVTFQMMMNEIL